MTDKGTAGNGTAGDETADQGTVKAARLFDVRRVIGGLFVIYGLIVAGIGLFDSASDLDKAQGVRINLWMGLGMLALGLFMLLWLRLNPTPLPKSASEETGKQPTTQD